MTITLVIVIATVLMSFQAFNNLSMKDNLIHSPYREAHQNEYYRFLSSGFIHADYMHLGINMFVFYQFGTEVEHQFTLEFGELMGRINYILLYTLGIVFADIPSFLKHKNNPHYAALGASGAVSAILFVFILFNPWSILLLFFIIPVPAILAAFLFLGYSHWAAKNARDNIGHDAHFFGAVFGFLFAIMLHPAWFMEFIQRLSVDFPL